MDPAPAMYLIRINGHLDATVLSVFPALAPQHHGACTVLAGLLDQAALYGVLAEIEALGLSGIPNVDVRVRTEVVGLEADDRLQAVIVRSLDGTGPVQLPANALFICISGTPRTDGAAGIGLATNAAGYLVTGGDAARDPSSGWPLPREPRPLETNVPGVFAAGDVRCGSVKRCAAAIGEGSMAVALVHRRLAEAGGD